MIHSNFTLQEVLRYSENEPGFVEAVRERVDDLYSKVEKAESEQRYLQSRIEALEEQLYFARVLIDNIEISLERCNSAKQARNALQDALSESYFER
jgi:chromosome segregation ATPase